MVMGMNVSAVAERAHREAMDTSAKDIAKFLQDSLGQKLVAYMTGVKDPNTVGRWASGAVEPRSGNDERLRTIFQIFNLLMDQESRHTVRAWFVGLNPQLDDTSPATAIAEGNVKDVMVAAKAFLAGG